MTATTSELRRPICRTTTPKMNTFEFGATARLNLSSAIVRAVLLRLPLTLRVLLLLLLGIHDHGA